jgi:alginate O-acetyltransferase complex protein AlgI
LPAGISFYTFQTISYVVDVYRGHGEAHRDYLAYLGFVIFFPHLVAGPLTRHDQLIPQLHAVARDGIAAHRKLSGAMLFALGLAKKVLIADRIAAFADPLILHVGGATTVEAWLALLGYTLQIYFDFSGYSDMAVGLGRLFGIELPQNFDSPYKSTSPRDFWRRWHMTLSRWLRDYLYISLGGNRKGIVRMRVNMLLTMTLGGLWHGAAWTFAVWGLYHGLLLAGHAAVESQWERLPVWTQRLATFVLVMLGWVLFRSPDFASALAWYRALVVGGAVTGLALGKLALLVAGGLAIVQLAPNTWQLDLEAARPRWGVVLGLVFATSIVATTLSSRFLYFQF